MLEPEQTVVGSVDEDFAVESNAGDIFLLGNSSWRISRLRGNDLLVTDAHGAPPTIPFWRGEAPGRTLELSEETSQLRQEFERRVAESDFTEWLRALEEREQRADDRDERTAISDVARAGDRPQQDSANFDHPLIRQLVDEVHCTPFAAFQTLLYIASQRAAIEAQAALVRAELNVKQVDFVSDESELVTYTARPNYRTLGPRFGKRMPQVAAAVEALDAAHVARVLAEGGEVGIAIDGTDHSLGAEDLTLALQPLEGYEVEAAAGHAVALALELDEELRREGLAREIVHAVQNARKDAGLEITDRIELALGGDEELLAAAREHEAYLAGEVLAIVVGDDADGEGAAAQIDGRPLRIAVRRV